MTNSYDYTFKIVILGATAVGKSSILRRFTNDQFQPHYSSTFGVDFRFKFFILNGKKVKLQIWDTAGQQRFRGLSSSYYKGAHAVILVYAKDSLNSLEQIKNYWLKQLDNHLENKGNIFVFANKYDDETQELQPSQIEFFTEKKIRLYKVSAKVGTSVRESIDDITETLMKIYSERDTKISIFLENKNKHTSIHEQMKKKDCC